MTWLQERLKRNSRKTKRKILLPDALQQLLSIEVGEAGPGGADVHPGHVVHGPEQPDPIIHAAIALHALEKLLGVVKDMEKNRIQF